MTEYEIEELVRYAQRCRWRQDEFLARLIRANEKIEVLVKMLQTSWGLQ